MTVNIKQVGKLSRTKELVAHFVLEARKGKKKASGDSAKRSSFLSLVMPKLAGDEGKAMADAIAAKDLDKFKTLWDKATESVFATLEKKFKEGNNEKTTKNNS